MSKRSQSPSVGGRNFLKGATLVGAAALTTPVAANTAISGVSGERTKASVPGQSLRQPRRCHRRKTPLVRRAAAEISWSMC
jgi:hypothetical protein